MFKNKQLIGGVVIAGFIAVFTLVGSTSTGSLFANTALAGYGGGSGSAAKVTICHNNNTIKVANSAVSAHLKHGDTRGACTGQVLGASTSSNEEQIKELRTQLVSLLQQLLSLLRQR